MAKDLRQEAAELRNSLKQDDVPPEEEFEEKSEAKATMNDADGDQYLDAKDDTGDPQTENAEPLPQPLAVLQFKQRGLAVAIAVAAVIGAAVTQQFQPLALVLASLYFLWKAWFINFDWNRGRIEQRVVVCTQRITRIKTTQITCRDQYNIYSYVVPDKKCDICEGYTYIIWSHINAPKNIMAYQPI